MKLNAIASVNDLKTYVEENDGVASVPMRIVRDAHGYDRLGVNVRARIGRELAGIGLGSFPENGQIPDNQNEWIRIYKQGSTAAQIIQAVLKVDRAGDKLIRRALSSDCEDKLEMIRDILQT